MPGEFTLPSHSDSLHKVFFTILLIIMACWLLEALHRRVKAGLNAMCSDSLCKLRGTTSDGNSRAEGDLLRLVVKIVDIPVQRQLSHWLQREVLLRPHLPNNAGAIKI